MSNLGLLFLRVSIGLLMLVGHGWPKLKKLTSGEPIQFPDPIGIGSEVGFVLVVFAEFFLFYFINSRNSASIEFNTVNQNNACGCVHR